MKVLDEHVYASNNANNSQLQEFRKHARTTG